ncbi:MAG: DUF1574 family protein, partial [Leptospiraceae bacterium]|nr:DUF1574 family protein [Leptospiraceae bacterium]
FIVDKQLFIWQLPDFFLRTASFVSYARKDDLQDELKEYLARPDRKRVVVMFGNSRTTTFSNEYIEQTHPNSILFNFSVPGGTADYYLYRLQLFAKEHIKPDHIFLAVSPQGLNATPSIAMDEVMLEGLSLGFVARNFYNYRPDHITNYLAKKTFWIYQYRPKIATIAHRLENNHKEAREFRYFLAKEQSSLKAERGSVKLDFKIKPPQDPDFLKHSAEGTWRDFLSPFTPDQGQIDFMERSLAECNQQQLQCTMLWTRVGPNLRHILKTRGLKAQPDRSVHTWFKELTKAMGSRHHIELLDLNDDGAMQCDYFFDSSHMASYCFPEMTDKLFEKLDRKQN